MSRGGRRLWGMIRKEILQIVRDPSSLAIAFALPAVLLFIFGYGVSLDANHVPLALVLEDNSAPALDLAASFEHSPYFRPQRYADLPTAEADLLAGKVQGIFWLRNNFARRVWTGGGAPISLSLNGVDANTARLVQGYVEGLWQAWLQRYAQSLGRRPQQAAQLEHRIWFNAEVRSTNFLVPGLIAVIMTLIGALLTSMVVAREWERGTMEALLVTPVTVREILLGKLIPYFILGLGGLLLSVAMAVWVFEVPLRGSLAALMSTSALFLLVALGMGLLISTLARNQFVAGQAAIVATFLPAFILSGFIFDINSMPAVVQAITHVIAARYYVAILHTVFLAGDVWPVILVNSGALAVMGVVFLLLVRLKTKKRLD
ncbi:MAG: ABC transporter permease [Deltaproteobacteria bacterium]|nr:ABC transporter permease [Deltaproteobacteria bacterium]